MNNLQINEFFVRDIFEKQKKNRQLMNIDKFNVSSSFSNIKLLKKKKNNKKT